MCATAFYLKRSSVLDPPVINEYEVFELEVAVAHFLTVHEIDDLRKRKKLAMEKAHLQLRLSIIGCTWARA